VEFTHSTLQDYEKRVHDLYQNFLFGTETDGADPVATQQYLIAISHLEMAHRHLALARLTQARALAGR